jgi:hypothetical protein
MAEKLARKTPVGAVAAPAGEQVLVFAAAEFFRHRFQARSLPGKSQPA